jgi:hypothetical protein
VKKGLGHYVENTGATDLVFLALFRVPYYEEVSFSDWLAGTPPKMVAATFNLDPAIVAKLPKGGVRTCCRGSNVALRLGVLRGCGAHRVTTSLGACVIVLIADVR